jgi:hypothetical protein
MYRKHKRTPKSLADAKTLAHPKIFGQCPNLGASQNLWRMAKLWSRKKILAPANVGAAGKVGGPTEELPYCLGLAESATADFSQAPLMVLFSSLLMW